MTVLEINGTFICSTPLILAPTSPVQKSAWLERIPIARMAPDRNPQHPSALFPPSLQTARVCHPAPIRSDGRTRMKRKMKLNSFSRPTHPSGDRNILNELGLGNLLTRNPHQRFSLNLHWNLWKSCKIPIWKTWWAHPRLITPSQLQTGSAKVCNPLHQGSVPDTPS